MSVDPAVGLGQIQAADPAFDLELFKREAVQTFLDVKMGIEQRDLTSVADLLSPRVYDDLRQDVSSLVARGAIHHYEGLTPTEVRVVAAEHGPQGDAITLRIGAVALDYLGSDSERYDSFAGGPTPLTEVWTFSRPPRGAATQRPECPTCGAPIDIDTGRICRYCGTLLPAAAPHAGWSVAAIADAAPAVEDGGRGA